MSYLDLALEVANSELPDNTACLEVSTDNTACLKKMLKEARQLQATLDDESQPLDQREALLPEFQDMIHQISGLLNSISHYELNELNELNPNHANAGLPYR